VLRRVWNHQVLCLIYLLTAILPGARAEQLPVRNYTLADGLARDQVNRIVRDSRGFLWFCTSDGLSRFDGYQFINYTPDHGLPHRNVSDLMEARDGTYWVATAGGVSRFNPLGSPQKWQPPTVFSANPQPGDFAPPMFSVFRPAAEGARVFFNLLQDRAGTIWCATSQGLYRLQGQGNDIALVKIQTNTYLDEAAILDLLEDRHGALWIASSRGLFRRLQDGRVENYETAASMTGDLRIHSLLEDRDGRIWVGAAGGLYSFNNRSGAERATVERIYTTRDGLTSNEWLNDLYQSPDGALWVGGGNDLHEAYRTENNQIKFRAVFHMGITSLAEDRDGNLWMGTESSGAMKLARKGFSTFSEQDGLSSGRTSSVFKLNDGTVCALSIDLPTSMPNSVVNCFDGQHFISVRPSFFTRVKLWGWGSNQITFQDHTGEWWFATGQGLYRLPAVSKVKELAHVAPLALYTRNEGLPFDDIFRLFEDSRGDIWISTTGSAEISSNTLSRWERATGRIVTYDAVREGLPIGNGPAAFGEDLQGNIWIGFYQGGLIARYKEGQFAMLTSPGELSSGNINDFHRDRTGRLWIATTSSGVAVVDDTAAEHPRFRTYTTGEGLSSNQALCITEDDFGHLYIGTGRGINRLDPSTGRVEHFTTADGLANNSVHSAVRDRKGALWFASLRGISRLQPAPERSTQPPVFISGIHISGLAQPISALGAIQVAGLILEPDQRQLQFDYFALGFAAGETLRYQHLLEGVDRDWSAPTALRSLTVSLTPGTYRFLVRAVSADGTTSPMPASISFTILRPVWQRWWFLTLATLLIGTTIFFLDRYRVRRLIELERVRTRIATDLHDDIGASLSRMAIMSEVVKQQTAATNGQSARLLTEIADSARSLVDSMSDIVWSIDPRRDDLRNVVLRVRQFASDVLEAKNINWEFRVPPDIEKLKLDPEQRRHLYLIYKEGLNNIARHAEGASEVKLSIAVQGHKLVGEICDNGRGFSAKTSAQRASNGRGGNGLPNMQARAEQLGGHLDIDANPDTGTRLTLTVPIK
jgi:ligand-binding sensor domain-containing protein/signal transduction histidine kinase